MSHMLTQYHTQLVAAEFCLSLAFVVWCCFISWTPFSEREKENQCVFVCVRGGGVSQHFDPAFDF